MPPPWTSCAPLVYKHSNPLTVPGLWSCCALHLQRLPIQASVMLTPMWKVLHDSQLDIKLLTSVPSSALVVLFTALQPLPFLAITCLPAWSSGCQVISSLTPCPLCLLIPHCVRLIALPSCTAFAAFELLNNRCKFIHTKLHSFKPFIKVST